MNSVRSMSVMSFTSRPVNAIGMAPGPTQRDGAYHDHPRRHSINSQIDCLAVDNSRGNALAILFSGQFRNPFADGFQLADGFLAKQHRHKGADRRHDREGTKEYCG